MKSYQPSYFVDQVIQLSGVTLSACHLIPIAGLLIESFFQAVSIISSLIQLPDFILVLTKCYRYAIVRDMTAAGAGLNKFCYAGLIAAHMNKTPRADDTATKVISSIFLSWINIDYFAAKSFSNINFFLKIIEFVERSKGWSSIEASNNNAENAMMGVTEEELYNLPTAEFVYRRGGFLNRQLTVYHVALHACAELKNVEVFSQIITWLSIATWYSCNQLLFIFLCLCALCSSICIRVYVVLWL